MSQLARRGCWLLATLCVLGCQSTGRMTRPPQMGPQARNTPPPKPAADANAQAQNPKPGQFPPAPVAATKEKTKQEPELVVRATAPVPGEDKEPTSEAKPATGLAKVQDLYRQAATKNAGIRDYVARFRRREVVDGKQLPDDVLLLRHQQESNSIYFKWLPGSPSEGRELIFVPGKYNNQLQIRTGKGDLLAGIRTELDPHSARATANCRRTIDEAGMRASITRFGGLLAAINAGKADAGTLQYVGARQRPECQTPMDCVAQRIAPGAEKHLPNGGVRYWFFCNDPHAQERGLPSLIVTVDEQQHEVEYYCYDRFNSNVGLRAEDFDPDHVWGNR
jgi:uncharacterized protein DUF1571